jgi:hypothetical protein
MHSPFQQPEPHPKYKRHYQWQAKMHNFLMDRADKPFTWGTNDCSMFVSDHIKEITGLDIATDRRGTYDSEFGAMKQYAEHGSLDNLFAALMLEHGFTEIPVVYAQRGDVLFNPQDDQPALMIMDFNGIHALGVHEKGVVRVKAIGNCTRAWRIA